MSEPSNQGVIGDQFGPRAGAYVTSLVHATGEDLAQATDWAARHRPGRVIDLGCGGGHAGFAVAPHVGELVATDLLPDMVAAVAEEAARRGLANIVTRQASVQALPFEAASFDAAITRFSAHHWGDFAAGLAEAARVLRPGAPALFIDAASPGPALLDSFIQTIELLRDRSHVRDYSAGEWCAALERAGFLVRNVITRRLRMDFSSWIARIGTPRVLADAILDLQRGAPEAVRRHFAIEPDGSFMLDCVAVETERS